VNTIDKLELELERRQFMNKNKTTDEHNIHGGVRID